MAIQICRLKDQKAVKTHKCSICRAVINPGEYYSVVSIFRSGRGWLQIKSCLSHSVEQIKNETKRRLGKYERGQIT